MGLRFWGGYGFGVGLGLRGFGLHRIVRALSAWHRHVMKAQFLAARSRDTHEPVPAARRLPQTPRPSKAQKLPDGNLVAEFTGPLETKPAMVRGL